MSNFVKILSPDIRFAKMLTLELSNIGFDSFELGGDLSESDKYFLIVDLDSTDAKETEKFPKGCTLIGFTKKDQPLDSGKLASYSAVFKRPFLMSDFLSAFDGDEISAASQKRSTTKIKHHKPHFLTVSQESTEAIWGDIKIPLSENEYKVLSLLCENRGEAVEREKIYTLLGAEEGNMGDVYICHLRRKIDNKLGLKLIYTVRGKGYMLKN